MNVAVFSLVLVSNNYITVESPNKRHFRDNINSAVLSFLEVQNVLEL